MLHAATTSKSEPTSPVAKAVASPEAILLAAGFEPIGKGLYANKGAVVSVGPANDSFEVFSDIQWTKGLELGQVKLVDVYEEYGFTRVNLYSSAGEGKLKARSGNTHHKMNEEESRPLSDALIRRERYIEDQLLLSGFEPVAGDRNNYSLRESKAFSHTVVYPDARLLAETGNRDRAGIQSQLLRLQAGRDCETKGMELVKIEACKDDGFNFVFENDLHQVQIVVNRTGALNRSICVKREPTLEEMQVSLAEARKEATGFTVAGVNETIAIEELAELAGKDIRELEKELKKANLLGPDDALVPLIASDNEIVIGQDLSHAQLAWPLKLARGKISMHDNRMSFNGMDFTITAQPCYTHGSCTLVPNENPSSYVTLTRDCDGKVLRFWGPLAESIQDFGFYGSFKSRYATRVNPQLIIDYFELGEDK